MELVEIWEPEGHYAWMKRWLETHQEQPHHYKIITFSAVAVVNCYTEAHDSVPAQKQALAINLFVLAGYPYFSKRL